MECQLLSMRDRKALVLKIINEYDMEEAHELKESVSCWNK